MNYDGAPGPVTSSGHEKWIEVSSFQWGVGRGISMNVGDNTKRDSSTPSISEVVVTHELDDSSITLFDLSVSGATGKTVKIDFCRAAVGQAAPEVYLHYEFENTLISGYSISGAGGSNRPSESLSLNFTKITATYTPLKEDNTPGNNVTKGFDLQTAKPF
jgi:type VI secretion system secreted protein Hcp